VARGGTGLDLAGLPSDETIVLVPAEEPAPGLGGLGGTGKTALAAAFARACRRNGTAGLVVWVTVTGRDAVMSGYAQAMRELDLVRHGGGSAELIAGSFLDWLANADRPWLVVLDDLADPAAIEGLWPQPSTGSAGRVLVTARRADAAAGAGRPRPVPVGAFGPREALEYLSADMNLDPGQRAGALDLAADLGFVPLTLSVAGAFIAGTGLDCRAYRARLAERRRMLAHAFPDDFGSAAAATWSLSLELADQIPPRGLAGRVLALISMLTPHGIPWAVLTSEPARAYLAGGDGALADVAEVRAALRNLGRAGLVVIDDTSSARTIRVHEMLQVITQSHLPPAEARLAARAAADALGQVWAAGDVPPPAAQALRDCTAKLQQITGPFLWTPQCHPVLLHAGHSLRAEGLAGSATAYWRAMLGTSQQTLGTEHPQTIAVRNLLGSACEASGHLDEAIAIYEAALGDTERTLGLGHPDTRLAGERLTRAYVAAGLTADAVGLADRFLKSAESNLGPDHADTLAARANLASVLIEAGQLHEAGAILADVVARRERLLGPMHPGTTAARVSLIGVYRDSGRLKEAIALGKRTLADLENGPGPDHPDTITARASLASAYRSAKKPKDALRLYERVLADRERGQGTDHPDTILARSDLALAYLSMKKMGVAIAQYEQALADSGRVLGPDHPITEALRQSLQEAAAYARSVTGIDLRSTTR
jgi:tetratricopeptide (TPR) repeat protein